MRRSYGVPVSGGGVWNVLWGVMSQVTEGLRKDLELLDLGPSECGAHYLENVISQFGQSI